MKRITFGLLAGILLVCCSANAQTLADYKLADPATLPAGAMVPPVSSGRATIYIEPMEGFDDYLAAALVKKGVPVIQTMDEAKADYVVTATWKESTRHAPLWTANHDDDAAAARLYEQATGQVIYAYAVNKKHTLHGEQTAAEAFAKHLDHWIRDKK